MVWFFGYYVSWRITASIVTLPACLLFTLMYFLPETPYWLVENDQMDLAKNSLQFYRGPNYDYSKELQEILENHKSKMLNGTSKSLKWILKRLSSKAFLKPFSIVGIIHSLTPLSGFDVHITYMFSILKDTGYTNDPGFVPIIVGIVRVICAAIIPFIIHRCNPKFLFSICQFIIALDMAILGILSFLLTYHPTLPILQYLEWLPMVLIINMIIMRAIGTLPVISILMAESYPTEIRALSASMTDCGALFIGSIIAKTFPGLKNLIGYHGMSILFVTVALINAFWGLLMIPDNRGKSLVKVEEHFEKK